MSNSLPPRLLIVDDEAAMRELLCDLVESAGLRATAVADGAAMREQLTLGDYALLLLDLRLKREDGLTLARAVRETSAIPIIILTGKGDETDRILGLELAADDYLMKPFNPRELIARIPEGDDVRMYWHGDWQDLCRGPHLQHTGQLPADAFRLTHVAGAYWLGDASRPMLQRIYGVAFRNRDELKARYDADIAKFCN